jgi:hypothetical protein
VDASPDGERLVVSGADGCLSVLESHDLDHRFQLVGHSGDVNACRFFPSSKVCDLFIRFAVVVLNCMLDFLLFLGYFEWRCR